jgi:hypothetical protein
MFLGAMQTCLTDFYGLDVAHDVNDFLITDRLLACALGGGARETDEELLIGEADGTAEVALYLEQSLLERLRDNNPIATLNKANIADFWTAFEGVSHFTYFVFKAMDDQSVTLLELELQAEVDKFVATSMLLRSQGGRVPAGLHRWLFDLPTFAASLSETELERYNDANRYAARLCRTLAGQFRERGWSEHARRELRRFYRLPRQEKIGYIEAAA